MAKPNSLMKKIQIACGLVAVGVFPLAGLNAQVNHVFRSFSKKISPEELNNILSSSNAVQKKIVADQVTDLVVEKFQNLSPEQRSRLLELAKEFPKGENTFNFSNKKRQFERAIQNDPELRKAAEELRDTIRDQNFSPDSSSRQAIEQQVRRAIQNRIQNEIEDQPLPGGRPFREGFVEPSVQPGQNLNLFPGRGNNRPGERGQAPANTRPLNNSGGFNRGERTGDSGSPNSGRNNSAFSDSGRNRSSPATPNVPGSSSPRENRVKKTRRDSFGGFGDDGFGDDGSQAIESPSASSRRASASGGDLPSESISHRVNRVVMDSVKKAMEKKVGDDSQAGEPSFERLLGKLMNSLANSTDSGIRRSGTGWPFRSRFDRMRNRRNSASVGGFPFRPLSNMGRGFFNPSFGSGMEMTPVSPRTMVMVILIVGMIVFVVVLALKKTPIAQMLGLMRPVSEVPVAPELPGVIPDQKGVVKLVDRYTLWLFGQKADWWNSRIIHQEVVEKAPECSLEIQSMMNIYDQARYAESSEPLSSETVNEIRSALEKLRSSAKSRDDQNINNTVQGPDTSGPFIGD